MTNQEFEIIIDKQQDLLSGKKNYTYYLIIICNKI